MIGSVSLVVALVILSVIPADARTRSGIPLSIVGWVLAGNAVGCFIAAAAQRSRGK
ncbi:hypothetical protein IC607_00905 [Cellulomonas sp. JH27-2]|uniref:hypothetical protein n=1 Tax=Cellulomonas sp. JH27-2 TaxID=2774139 RepID=UPI00177CE5EB|nr:hypothetical protein [Cellulomonas sp. JH27-2]MBD8057527.1 hypothetical protein [Cellulomonas sp. JH27-2]